MTDLISRDAAIAWFFRPYSNEESYSNLDVEKALNELPAVDAVPVVHARWIPHKTPSGHTTIFERCSACKQPTLVTRKTPYCPWCGAKMDDEQRDSE